MYSIACDSYSTQEGVQWSGDQVLVILEKLNYGDDQFVPWFIQNLYRGDNNVGLLYVLG